MAFTKHVLFSFLILTASAFANTGELLEGYRSVANELAYDHYEATQDAAKALVRVSEDWLKATPETNPNVPYVKKLVEGAKAISLTKDEASQRKLFSTLSEGACRLLKADLEQQKTWQLYFCPMVKTFAFWAQKKTDKMANPYMGTEMLQCGTKKAWTAIP